MNLKQDVKEVRLASNEDCFLCDVVCGEDTWAVEINAKLPIGIFGAKIGKTFYGHALCIEQLSARMGQVVYIVRTKA